MPIQNISGANVNLNSTKTKKTFLSNFSSCKNSENQYTYEKAYRKRVIGVFATTFIGVATAMAITLKGKGHEINPIKLFHTAPKKWGIFTVKYDEDSYDLQKLVGRLAVGSVGGGLIGGAIFDKKENMKAKYRESIIQLVGNIATPLLCVTLGMGGFKKLEPEILNLISKKSKNTQQAIKAFSQVAATGICLFTGIFLGNKMGNFINEKLFNIKKHCRKINVTDMSPHIDDLCVATSLVSPGNGVGVYIQRLIPLAMMISGISTGMAHEEPGSHQKTKQTKGS